MSVEEKLERLLDQNVLTASWSADAKRLMVGWVMEIFNESRPHGEWIYIGISETTGLKIVKCTRCKKRQYGSTDFCSNCGADMRKEGEAE